MTEDTTGRTGYYQGKAREKDESPINPKIVDNYGPWMLAPRRSWRSQTNKNIENAKVSRDVEIWMLKHFLHDPMQLPLGD